MNRYTLTLLLAGLLTGSTIQAQTTGAGPANRLSGRITYEGMRQIDRSQMRMVINGQEVRPGSPGAPDAPEGMPDVISFTQKLVFAGNMAKEERDRPQNMVRQMTMDGPGDSPRPAQNRRMNFPIEQESFLDLAGHKRIEVMTIKQDSVTQMYQTERPMPTPEGWQTSDKTKKIAGYLCHKATATRRPNRRMRGNGAAPATGNDAAEETYTVWYTTDLPFTYSPVADLTPPAGVVLQIESDKESFKATKVSLEAVPETSVQPPKNAKPIAAAEMEQIRRKAMADFRQKMMTNMPFPGRN
ncbi:GLPGLI family protein [Spirosoma taeanense]|uniref:GLPGLI family protein n=1 Tax=Spirosoma taeanense TaxID=2735870 RepID=A0A6M5Y560_9BACT|nr:GLPGLI family protein [Spirosoma taeanense]QJW88594.1 GLPGLI family protein [Spirosoma taeanense]